MTSRVRWIFGAALVVGAIAPAVAQTGAAPAAPASKSAGVQVDVSKNAQLTPEQQLAEADVALSKMERASSGIRRQLEQARKDRDVVKTLCLDDKLSQIDVAIRSARERKNALVAAASRKDSELSNHEFVILMVLRQRGDQLVAEANQCIGEESSYLEKTKVVTTVDPGISQGDDGNYPQTGPLPGFIIDPPSCVSCAR
jgi:hypothetical protein